MLKYTKFMLTPLLTLIMSAGVLLGGIWMWSGFAMIAVILILGDLLLGDDLSHPEYRFPGVLRFFTYLAFPVLLISLVALAWATGTGSQDFLGIGATIHAWTGYDAIASRNASTWFHYTGALLAYALLLAGYGLNAGHELVHQTANKLSLTVGRLLCAMSSNADFSIEHVYGHHLHVATDLDPATAKRGENVYPFIFRSWWNGHKSAWNIEKRRLTNRGYSVFSWRNLMLRGYVMTAAYAGMFYLAGSWRGVGIFFIASFGGKIVLEIVNYMEHYGLVRLPGEPVQPKHSWNTNRRMSSIILYSLTRHSAHHEKGDLAYWKLDAYPEAPEMPQGYLTTILIALVPPLYKKVMEPKLAEWDAKHASPEELTVLQKAA